MSLPLGKWSTDGLFWSTTKHGTKCLICPNQCLIADGEAGLCHSRVSCGGKLYSIAYGNPCAVNIDPIEKKPFYHFLPGSKAFSVGMAGCNLACLGCQNWTISHVGPNETRNIDLMPERLVAQAIANQCQSIAYTYTEPTSFYEYTFDSARLARQEKIKNVLVTAGYINKEPLRNWCKYIDAARVDLKSFSNDIYKKMNSGALKPILDTLKTFAEEGIWLEIINLVIPEWTDDLKMIGQMCDWLVQNGLSDCPIHFNRFYPDYQLAYLPATPIGVLMQAREIAHSAGIKYVYIGNVPGIDSQNTLCPGCKQVIVERRGFTLVKNNIEKGCCSKCGQKVAGVWE
jgi:pyruvate formate lyase activating enzyme